MIMAGKGNPPGTGRPRGAKNKKTAAMRHAEKHGVSPLDFLLGEMNNIENNQAVRIDAAKAAAPYCHSRLQTLTVEERPYDGDPNTLTSEFLASIVATYRGSDADTEKESRKQLN